MKTDEFTELIPTNGRKSFYGKAIVQRKNDGTEILLSYGTPIIMKKKHGKLYRFLDEPLTVTTNTHVISYCGLHKKDYEKLPKVK